MLKACPNIHIEPLSKNHKTYMFQASKGMSAYLLAYSNYVQQKNIDSMVRY